MKTYRKTATIKAKLFEKGDENGMIHKEDMPGAIEDVKNRLQPDLIPYISTLENQYHKGEFGKYYLCVGVKGEKWLVEKEIFESTYKEIITHQTNEESAKEEEWDEPEDIIESSWDKMKFKVNPGDSILIHWDDIEPDIGYVFTLPGQVVDEADFFIHVPNPRNPSGKDNAPEVHIHISKLLNNDRVVSLSQPQSK
jgi:hypothetical protein